MPEWINTWEFSFSHTGEIVTIYIDYRLLDGVISDTIQRHSIQISDAKFNLIQSDIGKMILRIWAYVEVRRQSGEIS